MNSPPSPPYHAKQKAPRRIEIQLPSLSELFPRDDPSPPYTPDYPHFSAQSSPGRYRSAHNHGRLDSPPVANKKRKADHDSDYADLYAAARPVVPPYAPHSLNKTGFPSTRHSSEVPTNRRSLPPLPVTATSTGAGAHYWARSGLGEVQDPFVTPTSHRSHRPVLGNRSPSSHSAIESDPPHGLPSPASFCTSGTADDPFYGHAIPFSEASSGIRLGTRSTRSSTHPSPNMRCPMESQIYGCCHASQEHTSRQPVSPCSPGLPLDVCYVDAYGAQKSHLIRAPIGHPKVGFCVGAVTQVTTPSGGASDSGKGKRRGNLPKEATAYLKEWFAAHTAHPYPNEEEKARFAAETGLSQAQIGNWFINARRRHLPGLLNDQAQESARRSTHVRNADHH